MAKFHVGQKVRIIRAAEIPELRGSEAIITGPHSKYIGWFPKSKRYEEVLTYPLHVFGDIRTVLATEDELEPILPEGLEADELIDALYEPDTIHLLEHMNT